MAMSGGPSPFKRFELFGFSLEFDNNGDMLAACLGCRHVVRSPDESSQALRDGLREIMTHVEGCPQWAEREELWKQGVRKLEPGPLAVEHWVDSNGENQVRAMYAGQSCAL